MTPARLTKFVEAYAEGLAKAVTAKRFRYALRPGDTPETYAVRVACTVHAFLERDGHVGAVHTDGLGFQYACTALGIQCSEQAINNFLNGE